jgi:pyruvate-ferredoxin/flavodoxin oxidoreductase
MRQAVDKLASQAIELLEIAVKDGLVKKELADALVAASQKDQPKSRPSALAWPS